MKDRLLLFLNKEEISATSLADEIGVQRSSISHILSGRNNPSYDFILKLLSKYDYLNADWLITGKGDMYKTEKQMQKPMKVMSGNLFDGQSIDNVAEEIKITDNKNTELASKNNIQNKTENMVTYVNNVEKIVYFYKNGTFKEYNPSE